MLHGFEDAEGMLLAGVVEKIHHRQRLVYPHQGFPLWRNIALDQRQMSFVGGLVEIRVQGERTVAGLDGAGDDALDQPFVFAAIVDQVGNGADPELMLRGKFHQVRQPRHLAIVLEYFADHRRGCEPCQLGQIAARLRVAGTHQHAAILRHERKDMAGLHQVCRLRVLLHRRLHGARAIGGGDARGDAFGGLDRQREVGAQRRAVVAHHQRQVQLPAAFLSQRQADEPAAVPRHEVDGLGSGEFRGDDQITFILALLLVHQNDHAPGANLVDDLGDRGDADLGIARKFFDVVHIATSCSTPLYIATLLMPQDRSLRGAVFATKQSCFSTVQDQEARLLRRSSSQ